MTFHPKNTIIFHLAKEKYTINTTYLEGPFNQGGKMEKKEEGKR